MKVILSRKGFDSESGGYPSPVLPDGRMISLPIPSNDRTKYSDLSVDDNLTYFDLMRQLRSTIKYRKEWHILTENTPCHLDPDINGSAMKRHISWKPLFGQNGTAQTHLKNKEVEEGDLFLFFGTFRKTIKRDGAYQFDSSQEFHAIYGYFEVKGKKPIDENPKFPEWMDYHPHIDSSRDPSNYRGNNTIYVARDRLTWQPDVPGAGLLNFTERLMLTKRGCSKSKWNLPPFFSEVNISYHSEKSWNWKDGYFQSAKRGQEFVIQRNKKIEDWVKDIIREGLMGVVAASDNTRPMLQANTCAL
jgi:hypothetical protein